MLVERRESGIHGSGVFARETLPKGSRAQITGESLSDPGELGHFCFEDEDDCWFLPDEPWRRLNHSLNPNCMVWDDMVIETVRTIEPDEELTIDYGYQP